MSPRGQLTWAPVARPPPPARARSGRTDQPASRIRGCRRRVWAAVPRGGGSGSLAIGGVGGARSRPPTALPARGGAWREAARWQSLATPALAPPRPSEAQGGLVAARRLRTLPPTPARTRHAATPAPKGMGVSTGIPYWGLSTPIKRRYVGGAPVGRSDVGRPSGHSAERQPMGSIGIHDANATDAGWEECGVRRRREGRRAETADAQPHSGTRQATARPGPATPFFPTFRHHFGPEVLTQACCTAAAPPVHTGRGGPRRQPTGAPPGPRASASGAAAARGGRAGAGRFFHLRGRGAAGNRGGRAALIQSWRLRLARPRRV